MQPSHQKHPSPVIHTLEASAGFGKSYAILKHISQDIPQNVSKWVIAVKSIHLIEQTLESLSTFNDSLSVLPLYTDSNTIANTVTESLAIYLTSSAVTLHDVIIITHNTLLNNLKGDIFSGWKLYIDEVPDLMVTSSLRFPKDNNPFGNLFSKNKSALTLKPRNISKIRTYLRSDLVNSNTKTFLERCLAHRNTFIHYRETAESVEYNTINFIDIQDIILHSEFTILSAARIYKSLSYEIMKHCGISFCESDITTKYTQYDNTSRITLSYLFEDVINPQGEVLNRGCSKYLLESYYNTSKNILIGKQDALYRENTLIGEGYEKVFDIVADNAIEYMFKEDNKFIYTTNINPYTKEYYKLFYKGNEVGHQIPYNTHGLNCYKDFRQVLCLFSAKPSPKLHGVFKLVQDATGIPVKKLMLENIYFEPSYQLITRSRIRDLEDNTSKILIVVQDRQVAEYIKDNYLTDAVIDSSIATKFPNNNAKRKSKRSFPYKYSMDSACRRAYERMCNSKGLKLDINSLEDDLLVREWLTKYLAKREKRKNNKHIGEY